jgi:hypothetical protein
MKVSPVMFMEATGAGNLIPMDASGLYELVSPATLVYTQTGKTVEVIRFFHDERDAEKSRVQVAGPLVRPWLPLAEFEFPPAVVKHLTARCIRDFNRMDLIAAG